MRTNSKRNRQSNAETQSRNNGLKAGKTGMIAAAGRLRAQILRDESGQALVIAALCVSFLMGGMALAVDVGYVHFRQQQLQTAADAAAIAAGLEIGNCGNTICANMKTAAEKALIEDGVTSATITPTSNCTVPSSPSGLTMIINVAPCVLGKTDLNYGNTYMAEVVLTEPQNTFFGSLIGFRKMNLMAHAEAGEPYINKPAPSFCVWTGSASFNGSSGADLESCGFYDEGNLSTDSDVDVTATSFQYSGSWGSASGTYNNCGTTCTWNLGDSETKPAYTSNVTPDPLASLTPPSQPATEDANNCSISNMDCWGNTVKNNTVSLPPGYYGGGINVNSGITANLSPGLYYFNGTFNVDSATVECTTCTAGGAGVTLYFESGTLQMNSSSTVKLNAPATGYTSNNDVANMLVWQAGGSKSSVQNTSGMDVDSDSTSVLSGIIYLPATGAELTINSGPNMTAAALDVNELLVDGTFTINGSNNLLGGSSSGTTTTLGTFALAE